MQAIFYVSSILVRLRRPGQTTVHRRVAKADTRPSSLHWINLHCRELGMPSSQGSLEFQVSDMHFACLNTGHSFKKFRPWILFISSSWLHMRDDSYTVQGEGIMQSNLLFYWSRGFSQWWNFTPPKPAARRARPGSNMINLAWDERNPLTDRRRQTDSSFNENKWPLSNPVGFFLLAYMMHKDNDLIPRWPSSLC